MNIFCCNTYYHLLISIIKSLKNKQKNDLLLFSDIHSNQLTSDTKLIDRVKKSKIFNDIIIFDYSDEEIAIEKKHLSPIYRYFLTKRIVKSNKYNFGRYDNVYLFFDCSLLGHVVMQQHIHYTLLEDGTNTFKSNFDRMKPKKNIKYYIKKAMNFSDYAQSKYIKEIEVNSISGLYIYGKKMVEVSKKKLFNSLSEDEKERIIKVFLKDTNVEKYSNAILLITQPLSEDKILSTEEDKIKLYSEIVSKYAKGNKIIIKKHPRETTNYQKCFKDCYIINDNFPIELINFYPIKLKKIITLASTSIELIDNCDKKIFLGWDYLKNFKDSVNDEREG